MCKPLCGCHGLPRAACEGSASSPAPPHLDLPAYSASKPQRISRAAISSLFLFASPWPRDPAPVVAHAALEVYYQGGHTRERGASGEHPTRPQRNKRPFFSRRAKPKRFEATFCKTGIELNPLYTRLQGPVGPLFPPETGLNIRSRRDALKTRIFAKSKFSIWAKTEAPSLPLSLAKSFPGIH